MEGFHEVDDQEMVGQLKSAEEKKREELVNELIESAPVDDGDLSTALPEAKYKVLDKVYGRDEDGLLYQAVIRRAIYGPIYHQQVQVGMASSSTDEALESPGSGKSNTESWQYFVHFLMWNVSWDRWLPEDKVLPMTEETERYAKTLIEEHKALRASLTRKNPGKKAFQNLDTTAFLSEWRKTLKRIDQQFLKNNSASAVSPPDMLPSKSTRAAQWSKSAIHSEIAFRNKGLISKKFQSTMNTIFLPFTLKKILVESWEIINQCGMVAKIPADVSVRDALEQYLKTKGISSSSNQIRVKKTLVNESAHCIHNQTPQTDHLLSTNGLDASRVEPQCDIKQIEAPDRVEGTVTSPSKGDLTQNTNGENEMEMHIEEEWVRLAEGIIQLFDEALPKRLLYKNELLQLQVIDSKGDDTQESYSDIYGCEHLLRLLVSLPSLMAEMMADDEAKPILAKINDFVRYLYKNQTVFFQQTYRKLSDIEQEVRQKEQTTKANKRRRTERDKQ